MAARSLKCGDCGALLKSGEEAREHADLTSHTTFSESTEAVLNLVCTTCGKPYRSKTESALHRKRTGHSKFVDKTLVTAKPISLEIPKPSASAEPEEGVEAGDSSQPEEMVLPEVDKSLLGELEAMGFPKARATRALHYSGNADLEEAVYWVVEHNNDLDIDEMPMVNAANKLMLGGGGVDGAIHNAAGPELRAACYEVPEVQPGVRCPTGEARITPAFRLPVSHVIHTVGPIYDVDDHQELSLRNAYRNSLRLAKENNIQFIALASGTDTFRTTPNRPLVSANTQIEAPNLKPSLTPEEMNIKAQELREQARKNKEEEKRMEREIEKERIRAGKELLEAKRIEEENERKRLLALRKAEKEEEKRAREKIRQKLEEDKAERRRKLGLPPEEPAAGKPFTPIVEEEKKSSLPVRPATKAEHMRDCLRSLKQNHKDDDAKVKRAFQTLLTYVGNVAKNPNEEKYRKIRLNNPAFQERVGSLQGGIEFLEHCGFEKIEGGEFLFLPGNQVDMAVLNTAGAELNSAIVNPFFGVL